jgi:hypothetical protein
MNTDKMKSNLNKTEFKKRLTEITSPEKEFYIIPYNFSGTPFCGTYDDSTFELTRNSLFIHVKAITIKGEFKGLDNTSTEVIFKIGWTKFRKYAFILFTCSAFIGLNTLLIVLRSNFDLSLKYAFLVLNGFLVFGCLWVLTINWITKRIIEQRFKEEFEIGLEDEWEKLVTSSANDHSR